MSARFGFARGSEARLVARRMGIDARHICRDFVMAKEGARTGDSNPELAGRAVLQALDRARLSVTDIGYLIGHTATPHQPLPSNIALVADLLDYRGPHVELRQACTGFANALMIASGLVAAGSKPVVIVGSETGSLFFDPAMLNGDTGQIVNMVQMGDGAGAIIVGLANDAAATIRAAWYGGIGVGRAPGISRNHGARRFDHDFAAIRASGHLLFEAGQATARDLGHNVAHADRIIPHQVSGRIGAQVAEHFGLPRERLFVNADRCGNTGSAAIWIALDQARTSLSVGERVLVLGAEASKYMYGGFVYDHG
jgi:3-oxoacyl-[acyl-carrier-protein] synthase-3